MSMLHGIGRWATPQVKKDLNVAAQGAQETLLNFFKNGLENIAPGEERALADTIMTEWGKDNLTPPTLTWQANNTWDIYHPNVHGQELQLGGVERLRPVMNALKEVIKAPTSYIDNRFIRDAASLEQYVDYKRIIEATIKKNGNTLKTAEVSLLLDRNSFFHSQLKGHPPFNPVPIKDKSTLQEVLGRLVDAADAKVTAKKHPAILKPVDAPAAEPVQAALHPLHPDQPYLKASAYPYAGGYATPTRPAHLQSVGGQTPHAVGGGQVSPSYGGYHPTYQGGYVQPHMPPAQPPVSPHIPLSPVVGKKPAPYAPPIQTKYEPPIGPTHPETPELKTPEFVEPETTSKTPDLDDLDEPEAPQTKSTPSTKSKTDPDVEDVADEVDTSETTSRPLPGKVGANKISVLQSFKATLPEVQEFKMEKPDLPDVPDGASLSKDAQKHRQWKTLKLFDHTKPESATRKQFSKKLQDIDNKAYEEFEKVRYLDAKVKKNEDDIKDALKELKTQARSARSNLQQLRYRKDSDPDKKADYEALIEYAKSLDKYVNDAQTYLNYKLESEKKKTDKKGTHYEEQYKKLYNAYKNKVDELKTAFRYEKDLPEAESYLQLRKNELDHAFSKGVTKITDEMPVDKKAPSHVQDKGAIDADWKKFQEEQGLVPETVKDNVDYFQGLAATAATTLPFYALGVPLGPFGVPLAVGSFMWGSNPAARNFVNQLREGNPRGMLNEFTKFVASNYDRVNEGFNPTKKNDPNYVPKLNHYEKSPFEIAQASTKEITREEAVQAAGLIGTHRTALSNAMNVPELLADQNIQHCYTQFTNNAITDHATLLDHANTLETSLKVALKDGFNDQNITADADQAKKLAELWKDPATHLQQTQQELNGMGDPTAYTGDRNTAQAGTVIGDAQLDQNDAHDILLRQVPLAVRGTHCRANILNSHQAANRANWHNNLNPAQTRALNDFITAYDKVQALKRKRNALIEQEHLLTVAKELKQFQKTLKTAQGIPS